MEACVARGPRAGEEAEVVQSFVRVGGRAHSLFIDCRRLPLPPTRGWGPTESNDAPRRIRAQPHWISTPSTIVAGVGRARGSGRLWTVGRPAGPGHNHAGSSLCRRRWWPAWGDETARRPRRRPCRRKPTSPSPTPRNEILCSCSHDFSLQSARLSRPMRIQLQSHQSHQPGQFERPISAHDAAQTWTFSLSLRLPSLSRRCGRRFSPRRRCHSAPASNPLPPDKTLS